MEKLTYHIAEIISRELGFNQDKKEVIAYGTFAMLHTLLSIGLTALFGLVFGVFIETMLVAFSVSILRKYSGGAHTSSPGTCAILSAGVAVGWASFIVFVITPFINLRAVIVLGILAFFWSYYIVYKLAPVDSLAKPIKTHKKKEKMRKISIKILYTYTGMVLLNIMTFLLNHEIRFLTFSLCIYGGIVWQSFTLTRGGDETIRKIDVFLRKILLFDKGGK